MINSRARGVLIPIGGNEDKGGEDEMHTLEFIDEGILSIVVEEAGGIDAKIVLVPTASSIPDEVCATYKDAFEKLGCTNVHFLDIRKAEDCTKASALELVRTANCVMFSGGDQSKITKLIKDTEIHKILTERYWNEKSNDSLFITIGGPLQTILTGTLGLLMLVLRRKSIYKNGMKTLDWLFVFLSLFGSLHRHSWLILHQIFFPFGRYAKGFPPRRYFHLQIPRNKFDLVLLKYL